MAIKLTERINIRFFLKLVELCLAVISIALIRDYNLQALNVDRHLFCIIIVGGFVLCTSLLLVSMATDPAIGTSIIAILYCAVGAVGFVTAGAFLIETYEDVGSSKLRDVGLSTGALCIINGAVFLVDTFFTFRSR